MKLTHEQFDRLTAAEQATLHELDAKLTTPLAAVASTARVAGWRARYDQLLAIANGAPRELDTAANIGIQFDILTDERYRTVRTEFRAATRRLEDATADYRTAATGFATLLARGQATRDSSDALLTARHAITLAVRAVDEALAVVLDVTGTLRVDACSRATDAR